MPSSSDGSISERLSELMVYAFIPGQECFGNLFRWPWDGYLKGPLLPTWSKTFTSINIHIISLHNNQLSNRPHYQDQLSTPIQQTVSPGNHRASSD